MLETRPPIGLILAGGRGRRMAGAKLTAPLGGRPLIDYPIQSLRAVLSDVAVISKPDVPLPPLPGVTVWMEPEVPRHPLVGIVEALALAGGRAVMVCAADLPFVTPGLIGRVLRARPSAPSTGPGPAPAVIVRCLGQTQPLLGCYEPAAAELLAPVAREARLPVRDAVAAIGPLHVDTEDPGELFNVNSPEDLAVAQARLDQPNVKS